MVRVVHFSTFLYGKAIQVICESKAADAGIISVNPCC